MLITQNQIPRDKYVAFSYEDLIVDLHVYYWLGKSSKRENELNAFYLFCDTTYKQVLKHESTRWLGFEKLEMYCQPLKSYFYQAQKSSQCFLNY
jgi:hypothetical protein